MFHTHQLTIYTYRAWKTYCRLCGRDVRRDNMSRHAFSKHGEWPTFMKPGQKPKKKPWHPDWQEFMNNPEPIWVTIDDDGESVRSDHVDDRRDSAPDHGCSDDGEDEQVEQVEP